MIEDFIANFLLGFSPAGEGKVGIWILQKKYICLTYSFIACLLGNLMIFPVFHKIIKLSNMFFLKNKIYRKFAIYLSLRARKKVGPVIKKHGIIGLFIFVAIPLPFTGSYLGTVASFVFGLNYKKSLIAISLGIIISLVFMLILYPHIQPYFT